MDVSFHASTISSSSSTTPISSQRPSVPTLFVCGYVAKRWHNSSLNTIITDLTPVYYVACNASGDFPRFRQLLKHAECLLFFVNEYTLADVSCLLALQYAWQLMIPIIMLRPPRTRLVITARATSRLRTKSMVSSNGTVIRSQSVGQEISNGGMEYGLLDESGLDYALLQDILYEGYRIAVVYDRLDHSRCMEAIRKRVVRATLPFHLKPTHPSGGISLQLEDRGGDDDEDEDEDDLDDLNRRQEMARNKRSSDKLSSTSGSSSKMRRPATPGRPRGADGNNSTQRLSKSKSPIPPRNRPVSPHNSPHLKAENTDSFNSLCSTRLRLSQSTGSLADRPKRGGKRHAAPGPATRPKAHGPPPNIKAGANGGRITRAPLAPIKVSPHPSSGSLGSSVAPSPSITSSLSSPFNRRMSMMSLDDVTNYNPTQYLVFPIHDTTKKPQLIRFPNDLLEETMKMDSQWGSDSDISEEVELAPRINGDIGLLDEVDSPIASPAPYNEPII